MERPVRGEAANNIGRVSRKVFIDLFFSRRDVYAVQMDDGSYRPVWKSVSPRIVDAHLAGGVTIGSYVVNQRGLVKFAVLDIDSHDGLDAARVALRDVLGSLDEKYRRGSIVEYSGQKGYHVWVVFDGLVAASAVRSEFADFDCEVFPKQDRVGADGLGNLVKLPLGVHRRTGKRCLFLDDDLAPLQDQAVALMDLYKRRVSVSAVPEAPPPQKDLYMLYNLYKIYKPESIGLGGLRPCFEAVKRDRVVLRGTDGHWFRVAFVCEAFAAGWSDAEIVEWFEDQPDFDESKTRYKVAEIVSRGYKPWRCETLRSRCGKIVSRYCKDCAYYQPKHILIHTPNK